VTKSASRLSLNAASLLCVLLVYPGLSCAQQESEQGHSIGKVSTRGDLIVVERKDGALGKANLFDLAGRTVHFIPEGSGYRVEAGALHWDTEFGPELTGAEVTPHEFSFPFSGKRWNSFLVGKTGSIRFEKQEKDV
jgi:hypothetical protein